MKKYQPAQIQKRLEKLHDEYRAKIDELAKEVMDKRIAPYFAERGLSFTVMNGFIQIYDSNGDRSPCPKFIENLDDIYAECGYKFSYALPDFNPQAQDFSDNDVKHFFKRSANDKRSAIAVAMSCCQLL
ncbi:hypothetical protein [Alishewanella phage vB_AspM_Slickus01]|nr:hypothetical protein [Alishewanella phage vB_AspM_Slickus01]